MGSHTGQRGERQSNNQPTSVSNLIKTLSGDDYEEELLKEHKVKKAQVLESTLKKLREFLHIFVFLTICFHLLELKLILGLLDYFRLFALQFHLS